MSRFQGLNYSFLNEDPRVERALIEKSTRHLLVVCGSGVRVQYLITHPGMRVVCCDLSQQQLAWTHLRLLSTKELDFSSYLSFWGFRKGSSGDERKKVLNQLPLEEPHRSILKELFEKNNWETPLFYGHYERFLQKRAPWMAKLLGYSLKGENRLKELQGRVGGVRWKGLVGAIACMARLASLRKKGKVPQKNDSRSFYTLYNQVLTNMLLQPCAEESPFLEMAFYGEVNQRALLPLESSPSLYEQAQKAIAGSEVSYVQGNVLEVGAGEGEFCGFDFVSLSNVLSYMEASEIQKGMARLSRRVADEGRVVAKTFLNHLGDEAMASFQQLPFPSLPFESFTEFYQQVLLKPLRRKEVV